MYFILRYIIEKNCLIGSQKLVFHDKIFMLEFIIYIKVFWTINKPQKVLCINIADCLTFFIYKSIGGFCL